MGKLVIRWDDYKKEVSNFLFGFKLGDCFSDTTIWCKDANGSILPIRSHKILLLMSSLYFRRRLLQDPSIEPELVVDELSYEYLSLILEFVYVGEVFVDETYLNSFIVVGQKLQVRGLCEDFDATTASTPAPIEKTFLPDLEDSSSSPDETFSPGKENGEVERFAEWSERKSKTGNKHDPGKDSDGVPKTKLKVASAEKKINARGVEKKAGSSDKQKITKVLTTKKEVDKKIKPKKDDAPKKATSAFIFFSAEESRKVREKHPEMSFAEVSKEVSRVWSELDHTAKAPYEDKAAADKERYNEEMSTYSTSKTTTSAATVETRKKDSNAPKKPQTAYKFFRIVEMKKVREANPEMPLKEVSKEVAARWGQLEPEKRKVWDAKAAEDKCRFEKETAAYNVSKAD